MTFRSMPEAIAMLGAASDAIERAALHDRETVAELAGAATRHDDELAELRDELVSLAARVDSLARTLAARTADAA